MRDEARCGASAATYSSRYASTCEHSCSAGTHVAKAYPLAMTVQAKANGKGVGGREQGEGGCVGGW